MVYFFAWYFLVTALGWVTFPLAWRLFPALADRGFSLARALALLLWGYLFWVLASLGALRNNPAGLFLALILLVCLSAYGFWKKMHKDSLPILGWIKANAKLIVAVEVIFFLAFAAWAFVRSSNPNIETAGGEKTMELAFINAILHSPTFPPHDPWLSGYSISYYYFGYVITAMLAKAAATPGAVAHNLMLALVFALCFTGTYGLLYNLLAAWRAKRPGPSAQSSLSLPLLGPLFLLLVSNFAGFLEVIHSRGLFWKFAQDGTASSTFWSWLGIKHLDQPPSLPLQLTPTRYIWWWQDSRVIQDYDLMGNFREIIDEFPAFSFLLGDLHPHVLAMPFGLLIIAATLNLFMGGWKGELNLRWVRLPVSPEHFISAALLLGGMAFLNTWDILFGFALLVGAHVLRRVHEEGWNWERLREAFVFGVPLAALAILFYLPFYVGFSSQAGGILPNLETPTRGAHLWVMFGPLFLALFAYLLYLGRGERTPARWKTGLGLGTGLLACLWVFSWLLAILVKWKMPDFVSGYLASQGFVSMLLFAGVATLKRLRYIVTLITLLALLIPSLAFLAHSRKKQEEQDVPGLASVEISPAILVLYMVFLGAVLVLAPEFVYLRDLFGYRINTIFKFYFQAWQLWSLAAAFGVAVLLQELRGAWKWAYSLGLVLVLVAALSFPAFALPNKTGDFLLPVFQRVLDTARLNGDPTPLRTALSVWTLDGAKGFRDRYPDDAAAAAWLSSAPAGVIVEAVGGQYSDYGRISVYSGLPTVVGWVGHEDQWRGTFDEQRQRERNVATLYQTNDWEEALSILQMYAVRYVVVGTLERTQYNVYELKFQHNLAEVFRSGDVVIYQVP